MRNKVTQKPKIGDRRSIKMFATLPVKARNITDNEYYYVWFENYTIHEEYRKVYLGFDYVERFVTVENTIK